MTEKNGSKSTRRVMQVLYDQRGNIMPMAAIGMIAMAGMVGGGVDVSRGYMVQNRLQNACDSAVLAGRRAVVDNGFDAAAKDQADAYFETNFDETGEGTSNTVFTPTATSDSNQIDGVASTVLDTTVMKLFGFDDMTLSVSCTASMSVGNSDVMMVLDTTGSMDWTINGNTTSNDSQRRITFLRAAMNDFYATVAAASAGGNTRVRYGFVPYSTSVNVGRLLQPSWLVDSVSMHTREPEYSTSTETEVVGYEPPVVENESGTSGTESDRWSNYTNTRYNRQSDCLNALPSNTNWDNVGSGTPVYRQYINDALQRITEDLVEQGQDRTIYRCRYRRNRGDYQRQQRDQYRILTSGTISTEDPIINEVTTSTFRTWLYKELPVNTADYKLFNPVTVKNGANATDVSYTWNGCIEERSTTDASSFSYSSVLGMSPSTNDLDLDTAPTSSDATKWAPLFSQLSYRRGTNRTIYNQSESYDGWQTSAPCPYEAQQFATMSADDFDDYTKELDPTGNTYHDLGMIWGGRLSSPTGMFASNVNDSPSNGGSVARHLIFMTDGFMQPNNTVHSAYGVEYYDKRVTGDGSSNHTSRHTSRFLATCEAVKAKGIRLWVIAFASELTTDLSTCASDDSAFDADSSASLNAAFQEIAKNVGELRVTQ